MNIEMIETLSKVVGIGGISIGVFLIIFRNNIKNKILANLNKDYAGKIFKLMLILIWSVSMMGMYAWLFVMPENEVTDYINFDLSKPISFTTGWIFIGYYNHQKNHYVKGPYTDIVFRPLGEQPYIDIPDTGDVIKINKARNVIIAKYKNLGLKYQLTSPPHIKEVITEEDYTGVKLNIGTLVLVGDVEISGSFGGPSSIWCRIIECEDFNDSCQKAWQLIIKKNYK